MGRAGPEGACLRLARAVSGHDSLCPPLHRRSYLSTLQASCWTRPLRDLELAALYTSIGVYLAIL